jgi:hypothetical protein
MPLLAFTKRATGFQCSFIIHVLFIFLPTFAPHNFFKTNKKIMATTADMRSGLIIKVDGSLYTVIDFGQNKTARGCSKSLGKIKGG